MSVTELRELVRRGSPDVCKSGAVVGQKFLWGAVLLKQSCPNCCHLWGFLRWDGFNVLLLLQELSEWFVKATKKWRERTESNRRQQPAGKPFAKLFETGLSNRRARAHFLHVFDRDDNEFRWTSLSGDKFWS